MTLMGTVINITWAGQAPMTVCWYTIKMMTETSLQPKKYRSQGMYNGRMDEETALATYDANNDGILTDLEALAYFDDNNDGVLNDQDAEFANLRFGKI